MHDLGMKKKRESGQKMYNGPIGGRMTDTDDSMEVPIRPDGLGKWV
jgi:hypothetical protein